MRPRFRWPWSLSAGSTASARRSRPTVGKIASEPSHPGGPPALCHNGPSQGGTMGKVLLAFLLIVAAAAAAAYFWLFRPHEQALATSRQQLAAATQEASALRGRVADLESIRDQLQKTSVELQQQVQAKEIELAALHSTQDELGGKLRQEITDKQVKITQVRAQLRGERADGKRFNPAEAALKP